MTLQTKPATPTGTRRVVGKGQFYEKGRGRYCAPVELDLPTFSQEDVERGEKLRRVRQDLDLSQKDAADAFGLRLATASGLEHGYHVFDLDEACRLLRAYAGAR